MVSLGPAQAPPTKEQLLAILREPVEKATRESVDSDVEPERLWSLRQAQESDFMWRGLQWLAPGMENGIAGLSPIGSPISGDGKPANTYDYNQNIYRGYGRAFISVLGQRIPNVVAAPDDPDDDESLRLTDLANRAGSILRSSWDLETQMLELTLHLWKSSTVFIYTPWVTDKQKYGSTQEPRMETRAVQTGPASYSCLNCGEQIPASNAEPPTACPACGSTMLQYRDPETTDVPEPVGVDEYDNGAVEFHLCTIMTVSCPFFTKKREDLPWISYEYDEYKYTLKALYGDLLKDLATSATGGATGSTASETASNIRATTASPNGVANKHADSRWNYRRLWWTPKMYHACEDSVREILEQNFPKGLKITSVQDRVILLEEEALCDVWSVVKPETSEYIFADPMGQDMIPAQRLKNDTLNIAYQTIEGGLPVSFVDPRVIDVEWWNNNRAEPNAIIPVIAATGATLGDSFHSTVPSAFSDQMLPWIAGVEDDARTIVGTTQALYGGIVPGDDQTAHEAELRKNAAMQKIGSTFVYIRKGLAQAMTNGVKMLARFGNGMMRKVEKGEQGYESLVVDLAQLQEKGWHFEAEEAFPMTHAEQRAYLLWLLANKDLAQSQGFTDPRNVRKNHALLGFTGYHVPDADIIDKGNAVIARLAKAAPIMQPQPDGSVDAQPSIEIDAFDDHAKMAQVAYSWCISDVGRRLQDSQQGQNAGFANVVAWGKAHMVAANPPPVPAPPQVKANVSIPLDKMGPDVAQTVLQDFHLVPNAPPPSPAPQGSAPAAKGQASQAAPIPPPGLGANAPTPGAPAGQPPHSGPVQ